MRREAIDGERYSSDKSRRKRSGSRPINHGCSVRDSRPGSSSPTLRQLRSPFGGPWPTPRVAPGSSLLDVHRTLRPTLHRGKTRVVPLRQRRWSVARGHQAGTLVPEHQGTIPVPSQDARKPAGGARNLARSTARSKGLATPSHRAAEGPRPAVGGEAPDGVGRLRPAACWRAAGRFGGEASTPPPSSPPTPAGR